jgi:hypothetical protein
VKQKWLSYREAAALVGRSTRNIRRWHAEGMQMREIDGQMFVEKDVLQAWYRDRLKASPVHYYRMRANARANGRPDPIRLHPAPGQNRPPASDAVRRSEPSQPVPEMPTLKRGAYQYSELVEALRGTPPSCAGDDRFTAERLTSVDTAEMEAMCAACPLVSLCRAFAAEAKPAAGYWAGLS